MPDWGTSSGMSRTVTARTPAFRWIQSLQGNHPTMREFPEASGQTFLAGAVVCLLATGDIRAAAAGEDSVLGVAMKDASGVTGKKCIVQIFGQDDIFDAVANADVTAAMVGDLVDLAANSQLNVGASTDQLFRVMALAPGATISTHPNYRHLYVQGAGDMQASQAPIAAL